MMGFRALRKDEMIDPGEKVEVIITLLAVLGVCSLIVWLFVSAKI
jgi:hypothetical protein